MKILQISILTFLGAAAVPAQVASYKSIGTPCTNQLGINVSMDSSLPVPGTVMKVGVTGRPGARGFLNFSPRWHLSGVDLSAMGMTGCRMYVKPDFGITLPIAWSTTSNRANLSFYLPTSAPKGIFYVNQAFAILPGANFAGVVTSDAGLGRTGIDPDLTPQQILAFAPLFKMHPDEYPRPIDPRDYINQCLFFHEVTGLDPAYNKKKRRWEHLLFGYDRADFWGPPLSHLSSFGLHSGGKNRRPNDSNRGSSWNVYLDRMGRVSGPRDANGKSPIFTHYRRIGDYQHEIQYWFLMDSKWDPSFVHEGHWQHITVHVRFGRIVGAYYATDEGKGNYFSASKMKFLGTHPIAYVSRWSHYLNPVPGSVGGFELKDGGFQWRSWMKVETLRSQPWRDYAGAWGEAGFTSRSTGQLGPWHMRHQK